MSLINITDIEAALGQDISTDDEPRIQWYIDAVSSFIENTTGVSFELHEDAVVVARADGKGIIEIDKIVSITRVEILDPWTGVYGTLPNPVFPTSYEYAFDGINRIMGLCPYETYRITLDYGWGTVPEDIKNVAVLLVMAGSGLDSTAVAGLKSYRVGDVEESYGISTTDTGEPQVTLSSLMTEVLGSYTSSTTYRL